MPEKIKKVLALLLVAVLLLGCCACGTKQQQDPTNVEEPSDDIQSAYSDDEVVTITVLVPEYADPTYPRRWDQNSMKIIKKVAREQFGIKFELQEVIGGDENFKAILNTMLAGGVNVPDVIRYDLPIETVNQMYENGQILNMSNYAEYMPDVVQTFEDVPSLKQNNCNANGDIIRIPAVTYNVQHVTNWGCIRVDWLNELGLEVPTTTDEFKAVLKAFQDNDMNGNGKKDELYFAYYQPMNTALAPAFGAYGITQAKDSWYADAQGNVYAAMLTDEAKEYVSYVAEMFSEGLFWTESFTDTGAQGMMLYNENCRAGQFGAYWDSLLNSLDAYAYGRPDEYNPMLPLTDGEHDQKIMVKHYGGSNTITLTADCPAPERVIAFYNWCYSEEAASVIYAGESLEDRVYWENIPVTEVLPEAISSQLNLKGDETCTRMTAAGEALIAMHSNIYGYLGAQNGLWPMKSIDTGTEIAIDFYSSYDQVASRSSSDVIMNNTYLNWPEQEGNSINNLALAVGSDEQNDVLVEHADLFVYMDEMYKKFMTGVEPMSNWDAFVTQCYNLGMNDVLKVIQARYDALNQ